MSRADVYIHATISHFRGCTDANHFDHECRYYGYRLDDAFDEDPRLQALDRAWFAQKKVLDIGCNEGLLTLSLAGKFGCKAVTGVDIDAVLVAKACKALSALRSQLAAQLKSQRLGGGCAACPSDTC